MSSGEKLDKVEDSPSKFGHCDYFFSPQILETQDNLDEPKEEGDSIMFDAQI